MAYDLYDLTESLARVNIDRDTIAAVTYAFGKQGDCSEWEGGFVLHMKSGDPWRFVFGWCDTTGWGCQDGAYVVHFNHEPRVDELVDAYRAEMHYAAGVTMWDDGDDEGRTAGLVLVEDEGDEMPVDLNRWVRGEIER